MELNLAMCIYNFPNLQLQPSKPSSFTKKKKKIKQVNNDMYPNYANCFKNKKL